jgi:hypothetical protein
MAPPIGSRFITSRRSIRKAKPTNKEPKKETGAHRPKRSIISEHY